MLSNKYTNIRMSFWKHEPPNPTDAWRNFGPKRLSVPTALATSPMSAPVFSQRADIELMSDIRRAESGEIRVLIIIFIKWFTLTHHFNFFYSTYPTLHLQQVLKAQSSIYSWLEFFPSESSAHKHWPKLSPQLCLQVTIKIEVNGINEGAKKPLIYTQIYF